MKSIKTNREIFMEKLEAADMSRFINMITGCGKCTRCSNSYWDGNASRCHKDANNSSCEEGISQYMESRVGEDLQLKYCKKYLIFRSHHHAMLGKYLATILFQEGIVDKSEPICEACEINNCSKCENFWRNIINMSDDYKKMLIKPYVKDYTVASIESIKDIEVKKMYERYSNKNIFILEILIPRIQDYELRIKAKLLMELILKDEEII